MNYPDKSTKKREKKAKDIYQNEAKQINCRMAQIKQ